MMKDKKGHLIGDYQDHRILDYEQMNDRLDHLKICIEQKEIGRTTFDYPIRHFTFGNRPISCDFNSRNTCCRTNYQLLFNSVYGVLRSKS